MSETYQHDSGSAEVARKPVAELDLSPGAVREIDTLQLYLNEVGKTPLLEPHQELELARRIERGDLAAKDHMITANLRLVVHIARHMHRAGRGIVLADSIQEGNIGLIRAVERFDYRRGVRFSSYGGWQITNRIQRAQWKSHAGTLTLDQYKLVFGKLPATIEDLSARFGREPTVAEVSEAMQISPAELEQLELNAQPPVSIDRPAKAGESADKSSALGDRLGTGEDEVMQPLVGRQREQTVLRALGKLPPNFLGRRVIELRFGVGEHPKPLKQEEVAQATGASLWQVRQMERAMLARLAVDQDLRNMPAA